jgi:hypothetical protein
VAGREPRAPPSYAGKSEATVVRVKCGEESASPKRKNLSRTGGRATQSKIVKRSIVLRRHDQNSALRTSSGAEDTASRGHRRRRFDGYRISWDGWVTGATANKLAAEQVSTAVVAVLTPICVEKFLQNSDAQANLAALQKISSGSL